MSITILRRESLCFLLRFWKMSQFSSCSSLKPTARWWFSKTDASLYISASSEPGETEVEIHKNKKQNTLKIILLYLAWCKSELTATHWELNHVPQCANIIKNLTWHHFYVFLCILKTGKVKETCQNILAVIIIDFNLYVFFSFF